MLLFVLFSYLAVISAVVSAAVVGPSLRPLRGVKKFPGARAKGYLVKLTNNASRTEILRRINLTGSDAATDWKIVNGFHGDLDQDPIDILRASHDVESISENGVVEVSSIETQNNAPWGLGRTSPTSASTFIAGSPKDLNYTYTYDSSGGTGVDVYVVDTGIYVEHEQFGGRARWGTAIIGTYGVDGTGHGTHCAGTIASQQFGIAKNASLIAVKVFDNRGGSSVGPIVSGLDWVFKNAQLSGRPSVVATSLRVAPFDVLTAATLSLTEAGIHVVASAGNQNYDASNDGPANVESVVTVGATTIDDSKADFSNCGEVVDIWALGQDIISTSKDGPNATEVRNGTSMGSPHVSGAIAYLISLEGNVSPREMSDKL